METEILNISLTTEEIKYALENRGIEPTKELDTLINKQ